MKDTLAVIIPFYNAQDYLDRCLTSCLLCPELDEIILVDDGSEDGSRQLVEQLQSKYAKIKLVTHLDKRNHGVAASRNLGIHAATTTWITFCDADDYYLEGRFEAFAKAEKKQDSIYFETIGSEDGTNTGISFPNEGLSISKFQSMLIASREERISIIGLIVQKLALETIGSFDESLKIGEDTDLIWRLAGRFPFCKLENRTPKVIRGSSLSSLTSNNNLVNRQRQKFYAKWMNISDEVVLSDKAKRRIRDSALYYNFIQDSQGKSPLLKAFNYLEFKLRRLGLLNLS